MNTLVCPVPSVVSTQLRNALDHLHPVIGHGGNLNNEALQYRVSLLEEVRKWDAYGRDGTEGITVEEIDKTKALMLKVLNYVNLRLQSRLLDLKMDIDILETTDAWKYGISV